MKTNIAFLIAFLGIAVLGAYLYFKNQPADPLMTEGYKRYLSSCIRAGEAEFTCRCQAGLLANKLPDDKLLLLAQAGEAMEANDTDTLNKIAKANPEIFVALEDLSGEAASCVLE